MKIYKVCVWKQHFSHFMTFQFVEKRNSQHGLLAYHKLRLLCCDRLTSQQKIKTVVLKQ